MKKDYCKFLAALLLFGSNGVVASRIALPSTEIVFLRTLIGSALLFAIFFASRGKFTFTKHKKQFLFLSVSGVAMWASWMFLYEAYQRLGVSLATLAYYCGPIIVMALAPLLFREKFTRRRLLCFAAILCGIFLINSQSLQEGKSVWGLFCGGLSAVMFACMVIFNKFAKDITGLENSLLQLFISFLTVAAFTGCKYGFAVRLAASDWLPVIFLGLVNTGIGCYLYFSSIGRLPVQTVAICGYLDPLSAVLFSVLILRETMSPWQMAGAALVLGGAVLAEDFGKNARPLAETAGRSC